MDIIARLATYWLCGLLGGLGYELLVHRGALAIPHVERAEDGTRYLRLGFLGSAVLGVIAAVLADTDAVTALTAALSGPLIVERVVQRGAQTVRARRQR